uniref:Uncharacterized protein n=1 Tax=Romanomermis culicivorax TaxID=13658 RepID=A0A915JC21_ROMCU
MNVSDVSTRMEVIEGEKEMFHLESPRGTVQKKSARLENVILTRNELDAEETKNSNFKQNDARNGFSTI